MQPAVAYQEPLPIKGDIAGENADCGPHLGLSKSGLDFFIAHVVPFWISSFAGNFSRVGHVSVLHDCGRDDHGKLLLVGARGGSNPVEKKLVALHGPSGLQVRIILVQAGGLRCRVKRSAPVAHITSVAGSRYSWKPPDEPVLYDRLPTRFKPDHPPIGISSWGAWHALRVSTCTKAVLSSYEGAVRS